ncbi:hypothetical protein [Robiginitalea marina]|uniref:DUF4174 domain-containing protein n=1 Tax=Robiginitalea marina TaxID=2954105 RepID=A0ABT1AZ50_9FLAO|nr:hypothetical protein [Robiginitalea marina]MCO5725216.1 hypothetical protein [Robiginitalea marina]
MKKTLLLVVLLFPLLKAGAQLNRYKYIVVPLQFEAFRQPNQHQTSTLVKHLFVQEGFTAVYDNALPEDLLAQPCLGLRTRLEDESSLFQTKVRLVLMDCQGRVVFETQEGKSREKDYKLSYREAISEAFSSLQGIAYAYTPPEEKRETVEVVAGVRETPAPVGDALEVPPSPEVVVAVVPVPSQETPEIGEEAELLYAQPVENGYQLVDSLPSVRMKLLNTSRPDTFIAMVDGVAQGMVYNKEGQWWHEFYLEGRPQLRKLRIKF